MIKESVQMWRAGCWGLKGWGWNTRREVVWKAMMLFLSPIHLTDTQSTGTDFFFSQWWLRISHNNVQLMVSCKTSKWSMVLNIGWASTRTGDTHTKKKIVLCLTWQALYGIDWKTVRRPNHWWENESNLFIYSLWS